MKQGFVIVTCLALVTAAGAQEPKGPAPILRIVADVDSAKAVISYTEARYIPKTVQREVVVDLGDRKEKRIEVVTELAREEYSTQVELKSCRFFTAAGKNVQLDGAVKQLKKNSVVALSKNDVLPAKEFLQALNAEVLVIVLPPSAPDAVPPPIERVPQIIPPPRIEIPPPAPRLPEIQLPKN